MFTCEDSYMYARKTFDPEKNVKFFTYLNIIIDYRIKKAFTTFTHDQVYLEEIQDVSQDTDYIKKIDIDNKVKKIDNFINEFKMGCKIINSRNDLDRKTLSELYYRIYKKDERPIDVANELGITKELLNKRLNKLNQIIRSNVKL